MPEMGLIQNDTAPLRARDIVLLARRGAAPTPRTASRSPTGSRPGTARCDARQPRLRGLHGLGVPGPARHLRRRARDRWPATTSAARGAGSRSSSCSTIPTSPWWDDTTTPDASRPRTSSRMRAMDEAGAELRAAFGDPDRWDWGRLHTATFQEATIGTGSGIGPLEWYFNEGPRGRAGRRRRRQQHVLPPEPRLPGPDDPEFVPLGIDQLFTVTNLPSYRLLVDLSDLDGARIVITTGQSGHPFDATTTTRSTPWRNGDTLPLPFTPATRSPRRPVATLTPQRREPVGAADVVVVGAGTMGAWTALRSRRAGWTTTLIDAFGAGHPRATSGDETRILRAAHGADTFYTRWSREARIGWQAFDDGGRRAVLRRGGHALVRPPRGRVRGPLDRDPDVARHPGPAARRRPTSPTAGRRSRSMTWRSPRSSRRPACCWHGTGWPPWPGRSPRDGGRFELAWAARAPRTGGGSSTSSPAMASGSAGGTFVFAAGPWLPRLFPEVAGELIRVTKQDVMFFGPPAGRRPVQRRVAPLLGRLRRRDLRHARRSPVAA